MDLSSVLAYKSLFLANRATSAMGQAQDGKKCTAAANTARCLITTSQGIVPLFAVAGTLSKTATDPSVKHIAQSIVKNNNIQNIVNAVSAPATHKAITGITKVASTLTKLGVVGNLTYATAKCIDAKPEDKNQVFMQAAGNCGGMYLCEHIYTKAIKEISPDIISKNAAKLAKKTKILPKNLLKNIKPKSILFGVGFAIASIGGSYLGEKVCDNIYLSTSKPAFQPALAKNPFSAVVTNINQFS